MKRIIAFLFSALVLAVLCAAQTDPGYGRGSFRQEGIASWYGSEFAGLPTASGEAFNPSALTAAHPTLPFGTLLKITNSHNNRQVVVRVNDRGPFTSARILDVSRAAAEQLDMISSGTAPVVIELADQGAMAYTPAPQQLPPIQQQVPAQTYSSQTLPPPQESQPPVRTGTINLEQYAQPGNAPLSNAPIYQALPPPVSATTGPVIYDSLPPPAGQVQQQPPAGQQQQSAPVYQSLSAAPPPQTSAPPPPPASAAPSPQASAAPIPQAAPASDLLWSLDAEAPASASSTPASAPPATAAPEPAPAPRAASATAAKISPRIPPAGQNRVYRLQIGSFKVPRNATETFDKLKRAGLNPAYERNGDYYRVVLAGIKAEEVPAIAEKLGAAGFTEAIIREER